MASFFLSSMFLFCVGILVYLHVCAHVCGGGRSTSDVISQDAFHLLFGFEVKFLTKTWGFLIQPGWLAVKAQRSASLSFLRATCTTCPLSCVSPTLPLLSKRCFLNDRIF